jgi:hypothetical protein
LEAVFLKPDEDWLEIIRGATQKAIATGDRVRCGDRRKWITKSVCKYPSRTARFRG